MGEQVKKDSVLNDLLSKVYLSKATNRPILQLIFDRNDDTSIMLLTICQPVQLYCLVIIIDVLQDWQLKYLCVEMET